jgi:hypothetical protein
MRPLADSTMRFHRRQSPGRCPFEQRFAWLLRVTLDNLHILDPSGFIRADISARQAMLELENNLSLTFTVLMNPVSEYRPSVKRGLLPFFMEIDFAPDQFLCLTLVESPGTAFPHIVLHLHKIIQRFNQMYIHFTSSSFTGFTGIRRLSFPPT